MVVGNRVWKYRAMRSVAYDGDDGRLAKGGKDWRGTVLVCIIYIIFGLNVNVLGLD